MSGLSFGQLSKLLCLFDSKSSDFSSWVDLRNDSLSPSIPSSFEFRWSCRFEDARGKLSALRTFRHNFDVEPCRLKNSWKFQRNRIAGRVGNVVPRAFVKPLFRTRSERKNALLFFFFFFLFSLAKILGARYSKKNVNFLSSFSPFRSFLPSSRSLSMKETNLSRRMRIYRPIRIQRASACGHVAREKFAVYKNGKIARGDYREGKKRIGSIGTFGT